MAPNPLRIDPTRTATLRMQFKKEITKRMRYLKGKVRNLIEVEDAFGLKKANVINTEIKYSSTQINIEDENILRFIRAYQRSLDPEDVIELETESHITIRYGLHTENPEDVAAFLDQPIKLKMGGLSAFESEKHDVLKLDITSNDLRKFNRSLGILPCTETFKVYRPHMTIAYLRSGTYAKYAGDKIGIEGLEFTFDKAYFSTPERVKTAITLNAFCPTGPGGGIDPTCSPDGSGSAYESLSSSEQEAIKDWSQMLYRESSAKEISPTSQQQLRGLEDALEKLPNHNGTVHRVMVISDPKDIQDLRGGLKKEGVYSPSRPVSTSKSGTLAMEEFGELAAGPDDTVVVFEMRAKTARDVSRLVSEEYHRQEEVIVRPGSNYVIDKVSRSKGPHGGNQIKVVMEERSQNTYVRDQYHKKIKYVQNVHNTRYKYLTSPEQLKKFQEWLMIEIDDTILTDDFWEYFIRLGYEKGAGKAFDAVRKSALVGDKKALSAAKEEFLRSAFSNPKSIEKVQLLAGRTFTELKDMTEAMANKMSRQLVEGFTQGLSPRDIARNINKEVDNIGKTRALRIARTEVARANAEGSLDSMEQLGVDEIGVAVEWSVSGLGETALGNESPCPLCAPLAGMVMSIKDAKGMFPRHPNCLCTPIPANVGEPTEKQTRTRAKIRASIEKSVKAENPDKDKSTWIGADKNVSEPPKSVV